MAGGQVDILDVPDLLELAYGCQPPLDPSSQGVAAELGRDDGDGHVVAAFVGEPLRVPGGVLGRRDRA
ncbi:MAG: hypothetical protein ACRDT2_05575, partial [Natronosporangium sp.]